MIRASRQTLIFIVLLVIGIVVLGTISMFSSKRNDKNQPRIEEIGKMSETRKVNLQKIKDNPWNFSGEIIEVDVLQILSADTSGKLLYVTCEQANGAAYQITDGTEIATLCVKSGIKLSVPRKIKAKVISKTLCKDYDSSQPVQVPPCKLYFPKSSTNPDNWTYKLEYIE